MRVLEREQWIAGFKCAQASRKRHPLPTLISIFELYDVYNIMGNTNFKYVILEAP